MENYEKEFLEYLDKNPPDLLAKGIKKRTIKTIYQPTDTPELDLHGLRTWEAKDAMISFIKKSRGGSIQKVRVITGKGLHSKNGPVLGKFIQDGLNHGKFGKIRKFRSGKAKEGGSGVFIIEL